MTAAAQVHTVRRRPDMTSGFGGQGSAEKWSIEPKSDDTK